VDDGGQRSRLKRGHAGALFAGDDAALARRMKKWPADIRKHVERLLAPARVVE
jgi:hypothetical protein